MRMNLVAMKEILFVSGIVVDIRIEMDFYQCFFVLFLWFRLVCFIVFLCVWFLFDILKLEATKVKIINFYKYNYIANFVCYFYFRSIYLCFVL